MTFARRRNACGALGDARNQTAAAHARHSGITARPGDRTAGEEITRGVGRRSRQLHRSAHQQAHDSWGHIHRGHRSWDNRDGSRIRARGGAPVGDDFEATGILGRLVTRVVPTTVRIRVRNATTSDTPRHIDSCGIAGRCKRYRHQLRSAVGWERNGLGSNLQAERCIGISDRYRLLAAEGRESHDQPRVFQHGQPARQLVHERHDRISCARAFVERQRVPPDLMGFFTTA